MRGIMLLILLIALGWASPLAAQGQPLDLATYERLLREAAAAAARGDRLDVEQVVPALSQARTIRMPDGALAPVDNRWLAEELARPNPDLPVVAARLGALIDALALRSPPAPADARERLEALLAAPPFSDPQARPREPSAIERLLDQLFRWLLEWLLDRLGPIGAPMAEAAAGEPGVVSSWLLTVMAAALLIGVLFLWLRGIRRTLRPEAMLPGPAELAARNTADARAQAAALAALGDYRGAVRLLALAALLWLDERGALPYDPHQTNREHLGRLRERPALRERLAPIVDTTDRVWYGGVAIDAADYAAAERQVDALRAEEERA